MTRKANWWVLINRSVALIIGISIWCMGCSKSFGLETPSQSATSVFNDIYDIMDKHYALFGVKQKDWILIRKKYEGLVNDSLDDSKLFDICADMLEELQDGHVSLQAPFRVSTYDNFYKLFPVNFNFSVIEKKYLKDKLRTSGPFVYGVDGQIGYLHYSSFQDDYTDYQLETVFSAFANTSGIIIDVRGNGGGIARNVNRLLRKLITSRQLTKYELQKKGPGHDQFSDPIAFYLDPGSNGYEKKVVLLTNRKCFSACNDFVSFVSSLGNVTVVGDQTGGGGSIPNSYVLVNGWKLQYSATVTLSSSKIPIDTGIQPDFRINISPLEEAAGLDPILEKAISILR